MKSYRFTSVGRGCVLALLTLLVLLARPAVSSAQLSRVGLSTEVIQAFVRGGTALRSRTDRYSWPGIHEYLRRCVGDGQPKAAPFVIYLAATAGYGAYPRARYSPDIDNGNGGFLVVWVVEAGNTGWGPIHSRTVSCTGGLLGVDQVIDPAVGYLESGPAIAYSATSKRFLVAFKGGFVTAKLVDNTGAGIGARL